MGYRGVAPEVGVMQKLNRKRERRVRGRRIWRSKCGAPVLQ
jgi:hypothetical protein